MESVNAKHGLKSLIRVEGKVPHTVMVLASGRTFAYGQNPDSTAGNTPGRLVERAIDEMLRTEGSAAEARGILASERQEALARISASSAMLDGHQPLAGADTEVRDSVEWARAVLSAVVRMVAGAPVRD